MSSLPLSFGAVVGKLGYGAVGFRRQLVETNLSLAFPDQDMSWVRRIAKASYVHVCREALASAKLAHASNSDVIASTNIINESLLKNAHGAVIASGHVGNQEMVIAALGARGYPFDVIVQRQANPLFDAALNGMRQRFGVRLIDRTHATMHTVRALRDGHMVGFAADQDAGRAGLFVPFFGRPASTHRGAALFAVRAEVPMIMVVALRRGSGYDVLCELISVDRAGELDDVVYRLLAAFTARLEQVVRSVPEQYLWLHRRWKTEERGIRE